MQQGERQRSRSPVEGKLWTSRPVTMKMAKSFAFVRWLLFSALHTPMFKASEIMLAGELLLLGNATERQQVIQRVTTAEAVIQNALALGKIFEQDRELGWVFFLDCTMARTVVEDKRMEVIKVFCQMFNGIEIIVLSYLFPLIFMQRCLCELAKPTSSEFIHLYQVSGQCLYRSIKDGTVKPEHMEDFEPELSELQREQYAHEEEVKRRLRFQKVLGHHMKQQMIDLKLARKAKGHWFKVQDEYDFSRNMIDTIQTLTPMNCMMAMKMREWYGDDAKDWPGANMPIFLMPTYRECKGLPPLPPLTVL